MGIDVINFNEQLTFKGLNNIDIKDIDSTGRLSDPLTGVRIRLKDYQLIYLRNKYPDMDIAPKRIISKSEYETYNKMIEDIKKDKIKREKEIKRKNTRRKIRLVKKNISKVISNPDINVFNKLSPKVKIAGASIIVSTILIGGFALNQEVVMAPTSMDISNFDNSNHDVGNSFNLSDINGIAASATLVSDGSEFVSLIEDTEALGESIEESSTEEISTEEKNVEVIDEVTQHRKEVINYYSGIYGINGDIAYQKIVELTNNFSSDEFNNGIIPGVMCKGSQVQSSSEDVLFITAIRHFAQIPSDFGLSWDDIRNNPSSYNDDKTYEECIALYGNVLGEGSNYLRDVAYGVFIAETGGNSNLLITQNNYGGIVGDGGFAAYSNKDQGAIEHLCNIKYYYFTNGMDTPGKMQEVYAPSYENDGAWWRSTVNEVMGYAENKLSVYDSELEKGMMK